MQTSSRKHTPFFTRPPEFSIMRYANRPRGPLYAARRASQVEQKYQTGYIHPARLVVGIKPLDYRVVKIH